MTLEAGQHESLGRHLVRCGLITDSQRLEAERLARQWNAPLERALLGLGYVTALPLSRSVADWSGMRFVDLLHEPPDSTLVVPEDRARYHELSAIPWRREDDRIVIAVAEDSEDMRRWAREQYGAGGHSFVRTSPFDILWSLQNLFRAEDDHDAREKLWTERPRLSAKRVMTTGQAIFFGGLGVALLVGLAVDPTTTLGAVGIVLSLLYLTIFVLKFWLTWTGASRDVDILVTPRDLARASDETLPVYTVMVAMYREAAVLPDLVEGLRNLDYPRAKLDIKFVLEENDHETIAAARALGCESIFEIVLVPSSEPKTKPKALNYALRFARGEYLTIYDAEDRPEPDQLRKAVAAFRKSPPEVVCIQARLNYFNADENFLTRMFTLEYCHWFDFLLPALDSLGIPVPLGGTSNHFITRVLRDAGAWDPYNVTEDADLGVRLTQAGYRVKVVNSTTFEEATSHYRHWLRQRSRWIKGYMQTWLVHMRAPLHLYRSLGHIGFWGFQFFVGGVPLVALLNPMLWAIFVLWATTGVSLLSALFPSPAYEIALFNFVVGNLMFVYFGLVAGFKRRYYGLALLGLLVPIYWLLHSAAAYLALWQLITKPHFWEKTTHGLSRIRPPPVMGGAR